MADVNANINIDINSSDALSSLRRLEGQINSFQRSVAASNAAAAAQQNAINRALFDGINATGLFTAKQVSAIDSASRFTNALEKNKLSLAEYTRYASSQLPGLSRVFRREFETMERVATDRVKAINSQYIAMGKTVDGVTKAIRSTPTGLASGYATEVALAAQRQQMFNKLIDDGSTKLLNWGKNTQWAGRQLMVGLSLPMAAFGAAAAAAFMELDKATVQLRRVYGDLDTTTAEVNANAEAIKNLGAEYTKYGIAVADTISLGARAAATGATNETLLAATEQTLRFATLGQIDYNQALDTTISLQTAFGVSNDDLASKIDFLNAVENQTILTIEDMSLAIPRVATVVRGLGGDVEDLAIMMTAMREGGVSAENAANGLKSGLASMINPTNRATEMLDKMGINLKGIVREYEGDLIGTIRAFGLELDKLSDMDRQRALEKTFGKYQYARMSALFDNIISKSGQAARAMDLASYSMEDLASIAEKELGTISESTTVKFQASLEQLKLAIAPLGEAFLKVATPAIEMITKIANAFNDLPDSIKNAIGVATIAIAGIGPVLLMGIGLMGNLIANIIKGIQWWRKLGARVSGNASAFEYMTKAELDALAASEALEASATGLTGRLNMQAGAVRALTAEYQRFASVAGVAGATMGNIGGRGPRGGRAPLKMARGGVVPGSGSGDKIPALLEPGETVVTKSASKQYAPIIAAMNAGTLQGFQQGLDPQSARESLVFAHAQAPSDLANDIVEKIKKEAPGSKYLQQATRMQGLSNFGVVAPERFNRGQMSGTQAAKLFQDPAIVDRTMYPMYEAIARSMGAKTPAQVKQIMGDPAIQKDVRSFADNIGRGLAQAGAKNIGDAQFYSVVEESLSKTDMSAASREAIQRSRNVTTVAAYGGGIREKGERVALGTARQEKIFGASGGVSYKSTSMIKKAGLVLGARFGEAVRSSLKIKSPSEDAKQVVKEYVDGMEVGAQQNAKDAAKAGTQTGQAYSGAVKQSVSATSAQQMTRQQYVTQQSAVRRNAYNVSRMEEAGMSQVQISRTQRRLEESKRRQEAAAVAAERRAQSARIREEESRRRQEQEAADRRMQRDERRASRGSRIRRGIGRAGGAVGALSLVPFMAQDEQGKFMGMDANMLGMGMMAAPMIGPAMKGVATGATALAGAMGVSVAAVAAPAAALAAVAVTAYALKKGLDNTIEAGRQFADAMTTSAEEQKKLADLFGTQTYAEKRRIKEVEKLTGLTSEQQKQGKEFLATEQGQAMAGEARTLLERGGGAMFSRNMATQLSQQVLSGAIDVSQAKAIATGIADELGRADLVAPITGEINRILAPNGDEIGAKPMQIQAAIQGNLEQDEAELERQMKNLTKTAEGAFMGQGGSVAKLWSGDWDAATAASVAYYNTLVSNSASMYSTYLDQRGLIKDQIEDLKEQIKQEDDKAKKIELQNQLLAAQNELRGIDEQGENLAARKQAEMNALRGSDEAQHSARLAIEEMGVVDTGALMHQMAMARERELGRFMTEGEREEFEISFMVDLQTGRIDPVALQTLQTANERLHGDAENIIDTVVDLQARGDFETANQILQLTSMMPDEVLTVFNNQIDGMDEEQVKAYADVMSMIPAEVATTIGVELAGLSADDLKTFKEDLASLQDLGIDTAQLIDEGGVKSINDAAKGLEDMEKQLSSKKIQKGLKEIGSIDSKNVKGKLTKQIEVVTELTDKDGKKITPKQAQEAQQALINSPELSQQTISQLPPDVAVKVIAMQVNAEQYKQMAIADRIAAQAFKTAEMPEEAAKATARADAFNAVYQAYKSAAIIGATSGGASMGMGGGGTTSGAPPVKEKPAGGGGGAEKKDPFKDLKSSIEAQLKSTIDVKANINKLIKGKLDVFKLLSKNNGIDDKIRKLGLEGTSLGDQIAGLDPKDAEKIIRQISDRSGRLNQTGRNLQTAQLAVDLDKSRTEYGERAVSAQAQRSARMTLQTGRFGRATTGTMAEIAGDPTRAKLYNDLVSEAQRKEQAWINAGSKNRKKAQSEWIAARDAVRSYVGEVERATREDTVELVLSGFDQRQLEQSNKDVAKSILQQSGLSEEQIESALDEQDFVTALADTEKEINSIISQISNARGKKRKELQSRLERERQTKQTLIDEFKVTFEAEVEVDKDKAANDAQEAWDKYSDLVNDAFDKEERRIKTQYSVEFQEQNGMTVEAMERQVVLNNRLIRQEQEKVDAKQEQINDYQRENDLVQQAISDMQRQNELRQRVADTYSRDLEIMSMQEAKITETFDNRISALDKVTQLNDQIISQQKSQLGLSQALTSGDVYAAAAAAQEIQAQNVQFATERQREALEISKQNQIDALTNAQGMTKKQIEEEINSIKEQNYQNSLLIQIKEDEIYQRSLLIRDLTNQIYEINENNIEPLKNANLAMQEKLDMHKQELDYAISNLTAAGLTKKEWADAQENAKGVIQSLRDGETTLEKARADWAAIAASAAAAAADAAKIGTGKTTKKFAGGFISRYASGAMVSGDGSRDSVNALLTPGEFVIRKSMVDKYGQTMFEKINQGSFDLPRYSIEGTPNVKPMSVSTVTAPVYNNNYSINVPVNQPNASADEIAYKVMNKIKGIDSASIRRVNGY